MIDYQALLAGLGLFLLGMTMLTDGLKALAGDALRRILMRFVAGPLSGLAWGALATALVQSSAATTVTTIGFVSAGLLTFEQSLGVVFGANLGTTSTGWIVSVLGFKVSLGKLSAPIVLLGILVRLLGRDRLADMGTMLCGLGLIFLGIDLLQRGMADAVTAIDLTSYAGTGLAGRLLLVAVGIVMTVIVQSSSAAMAATLSAVHGGMVSLDEGAALVIGQNVGTTLTAIVATVGGTAAARRTALAHTLFNVATGVFALMAAPSLVALLRTALGDGGSDAALVLAAFHTAFNVIGVVLLLPLVRPFARLLLWLVPEQQGTATQFLSRAVAQVGAVALEAARRALLAIRREAMALGSELLATGRLPRRKERLAHLHGELDRVQDFVHQLGQGAQSADESIRQVALFHAADHVGRLLHRLTDATANVAQPGADLAPALQRLREALATAAADGDAVDPAALAATSRWLASWRRDHRLVLLGQAAQARLSPDEADRRIETMLWADGLAYHLWRSAHYLQSPPPQPEPSAASAAEQRGDER